MGLTKREFLKRLDAALEKVAAEIAGNRGGDGPEHKFARGLSMEGYAGGYQQALYDVDALLRHGYPNDPRHYWNNG